MEISLTWIDELVNLETVNLSELVNKLTLGGFEVEEIQEIKIKNKKTIILDISATANRSDSLSIRGLALEIAALLNQQLKMSNYSKKTFSWANKTQNVSKLSLKTLNCSGFIGLIIENLIDLSPPKWLKQKLRVSNIIVENNLKDFQNYIRLETGYPFEFYDLNKIYSNLDEKKFNLNLTSSHNLANFSATNKKNYTMDNSLLVLKANQLVLSIGGIISNKNVDYTSKTDSLFIEGSIFNATKIRQQSRTLGLRTERSARYEKALKNTHLLESTYRLISLLRIKNPNLVCRLHTFAKSREEPVQIILLKYETVKNVLGPIYNKKRNYINEITQPSNYCYITVQEITQLLDRLKFSAKYNQQEKSWEINVPTLRNDDISLEIDIIEEIGRLYGFNNFLARLPNIKQIGIEDSYYKIRNKLTSCFINFGLNELVQYSLVSNKIYKKNEIKLLNPLVKEYSTLRSSLLPSLIETVKLNIKNCNLNLEGFEYGHIFDGNCLQNLNETEYLAGIFGGVNIRANWDESIKNLTWFEAKGKIEQLFEKLNLLIYWKIYSPLKEEELLHPYRTTEIYLTNGNKIGIFFQINSIISKNLGISKNLYLFEFNLCNIHNQIYNNKIVIYEEYSIFPKIIKDLSFIVRNDISFNSLKNILYLNGTKYLNEIKLLDKYHGKSIPENSTSFCLQFIFQSDQSTLQTKKVEIIVNKFKLILVQKFNAQIRK